MVFLTFESVFNPASPNGITNITFSGILKDEAHEKELWEAYRNKSIFPLHGTHEENVRAGLLGSITYLDLSKAKWIIVQEHSDIEIATAVPKMEILKS